MKWRISAFLLLFAAACVEPSHQPKTTQPNEVGHDHTQTATTVPPPEKTVSISPEVTALLKPDPDIETTITPEEVKATLDAARATEPVSTRVKIPVGGETAWGQLEKDKRSKDAAYEQRLDGTMVFANGDRYHASGCSGLYIEDRDSSGRYFRRFVGRSITLRTAMTNRLTRHESCGAPSYEYKY